MSEKIQILSFFNNLFYQICALASDLPQNIKENLGIEKFVDENLKEILNEPLKENFIFAPNGEYFLMRI
ncbi:hypothetical protein ELQ16_01555 [Campylobacter sp. US33a]|nr:hypothetical protein ELQ16_01555 [Campylobacter sp. US33a]